MDKSKEDIFIGTIAESILEKQVIWVTFVYTNTFSSK